eukprot:CAMPEP_0194482798 /NCGR_PEP_ID=MMETSP0253-20130528/4573_1 /TAXON_ID=2966 /ORGANISM="Noctiluca scintillans" /LENGTH=499 /DNA_ID=CAMNT_0039322359 /DNA_START=67 /DNA_END=1566 /DNA_ORIENTATION=-
MGIGRSSPSAAKNLEETAQPPTVEVGFQKKVKSGGIRHSMFIIDNKTRIQDSYDIDRKKIGQGSYGSVSKAKHKATNQIRAVKTMSKSRLKDIERFRLEIAVMKMMDHPSIIKLFETFEDRYNIYLVMELCSGGELFDRIIDAGHFTEVQAAIIMQQIIRAIYYMHQNGICHRDLKPENFLLYTKEPIDKNILKIIDFGLACKFDAAKPLTTKAGTPYYVAPQVLQGSYDQSSDLWSCGVIMFVLLCGYPPFHGDTDAQVLQKVKRGDFKFVREDWKDVSQGAKDLITNLLRMKPEDRFTAEQALTDPWIRDHAPQAVTVELEPTFINKLRHFQSANQLKQAALQIMAKQLTEDQLKQLRDVFQSLDVNQDGCLTIQEMRDGLARSNISDVPADLQQIMEHIDSDGSGEIEYNEFLAACLDRRLYMKEDVCWSAFRVFDRNGDGKISKEELRQVLHDSSVQEVAGTAAASIEMLMNDVDRNGDGEIDFQEFFAMMKEKH